jgi:hypothetical protein
MGQSESRPNRQSSYYYPSPTISTDYSAPRYAVKKDSYEFWNTVDGRVPNSIGSRLSDYQSTRYVESARPISTVYSPPVTVSTTLPISTSFPVNATYSTPLVAPVPSTVSAYPVVNATYSSLPTSSVIYPTQSYLPASTTYPSTLYSSYSGTQPFPAYVTPPLYASRY